MADVLAYCVNERMKGRRGYLEGYFRQFKDMSATHINEDEDLVLNGFQKIRGDAELNASAAAEVSLTTQAEIQVVETAVTVKLEEKKETGG